MVVTRKCNNLVYTAPPHFCPMLRGGVIAEFYGTMNMYSSLEVYTIDNTCLSLRTLSYTTVKATVT